MELTERTISSEILYDGRVLRLRRDQAELENGRVATREVVEHVPGVGIVPVDAEGNVSLVRQYRYPAGCPLLEIPAGKAESGETALECAVRELAEETGLRAERFISLGSFYPTPGYCSEVLYLYLALGLSAGETNPDEDEFLNVETLPLTRLVELAMDGTLNDGKTIIGILKADRILRGNAMSE